MNLIANPTLVAPSPAPTYVTSNLQLSPSLPYKIVRLFWWLLHQKEVWNEENRHLLVVGRLIRATGTSPYLALPARLIAAVKESLALGLQIESFFDAKRELKLSIQANTPYIVYCRPLRAARLGAFSKLIPVCFIRKIEIRIKKGILYIRIVGRALARFSAESFKLSMTAIDFLEAFFSNDPGVTAAAIDELLINAFTLPRTVVQKKEFILEKADNYQKGLNRLFRFAGIPFSSTELSSDLETIIGIFESIDKGTQLIGSDLQKGANTALLLAGFYKV